MNIVGIIPARMGSSRFPGKPLKNILGKPMIAHVYHRSKMANILKDVYIATCDKEIESYCLKNNLNVVMTSKKHKRASDRTAEAMLKIEKQLNKSIDIIVMIQGDEPMIWPQMIKESLKPMLHDKNIQVVNLMAALKSPDEYKDINEVKVVADLSNFALYFSREPIPNFRARNRAAVTYKQVCVIPFRRDFLIKFNRLSPTPLEIAESVDMLRILEHGYKVKMVLTKFNTCSVDTPQDLCQVEKLMQKDPLIKKY
ncbi:MAG: 3-deoxy-manno-octulosonate cytidylyltransferase [Candidatus Omnitrophica bacterium]|nr:3-deoxy-manno-octulosonate cytidylyltransferase [Candidatus Omnitrophota bacterium]